MQPTMDPSPQPQVKINSEPVAAKSKLVVVSIVTLLYWMTLYIYVPILSPYLDDRGLSMSWIGFILGSYGLTQVLTRLPIGLYSDMMSKRKPFIIAGMLAGLFSCILFTLPGTWGGPLSGRLLAGLCATAWVPLTVMYASYYPSNQTHKAMGTLSFLTVIGQLAGMSASGWLAEWGGWNAAFTTGIFIAAAGAGVALFLHEPKTSPPDAKIPRSSLLRSPAVTSVFKSRLLWRVAVLSLLAHGILFITMFGFTPLQAVELGASEGQLTLIVIAFMVPHAFVSLWTGRWLVPRFGYRNVTVFGFLAAAVFTAAIPFSHSLWALAVTQALNGIAQALYFPLLLSLAIRDFGPTQRATAMGLFQSTYSFGMFMGPYIAGGLNSFGGLKAGFYFGALLGLIAIPIAWNKQLHRK